MATKKKTIKSEQAPEGDHSAQKAPAPDYVVFARRFRPQSFETVVGQITVTSALRHALKTGRLAQAYIFAGPRGVGKTSLARIFAKALNCLKGTGPHGVAQEPCNACDSCLAIQDGSALDVIEMDAATNRGINEIRELRDSVGLSPSQLRFKVYIVDEVHMLTNEAWNAFLKTLEEPPAHVRFVFATTDADKIPETILSRCQRFDLRRIGIPDIVRRLRQICDEEKIETDDIALDRIAGLARGGLRDAESTLDQAVNLGEGKVTDEVVRQIAGAAPDEVILELLDSCSEGKVSEALTQVGLAMDAGADPDDLIVSLCENLRGLLLLKTCGKDSSLLDGQRHLIGSFEKLGARLSEDQVLMLIQLFSAARRQMRDAAQARLPLEMAVIRAARAGDLVDLGRLVEVMERGRSVAPAEGAGRFAAREGPRPNASGRPVGTDDSSQAALPPTRSQASNSRQADAIPQVAPRESSGIAVGRPEKWDELLAAIRPVPRGSMMAGALGNAQTADLKKEDGCLELGYSAGQVFWRERLEKPEHKQALEKVLQEVFGITLELRIVQVPEGIRKVLPRRSTAIETQDAGADEIRGRQNPAREGQTGKAAKKDVIEYKSEDALPYSESYQAVEISDVAGESVGEDSKPSQDMDVSPAGILPAREATLEERKAIEIHPMVKTLREMVQGEIIKIIRH